MNVAASLWLGGGFGVLAIVLNQIHARLALIEITLNEGLAPGHQRSQSASSDVRADPRELLSPGVHIFLSRNCLACQRLLDELESRPPGLSADVALHYVDRPRPIARKVAASLGAELDEQRSELAQACGADPLPYTIAIGAEALLAQSVTPSVAEVAATARHGGIQAT